MRLFTVYREKNLWQKAGVQVFRPLTTMHPFSPGNLMPLMLMAIESIAAKFRANYRLMMERLELEHLIDQNTRKDAP